MRRIRPCLLVGMVIFRAALASAQLVKPVHPLWKPIADTVYLQEVSSLINTDHALTAVAVHEGARYVGDAGGVSSVEGEFLRKAAGPNGLVSRLRSLNGTLYAATSDGLWTLSGGSWAKRTSQPIIDICLHDGRVVVASGGKLFTLGGQGLRR